MEHYKVVLSREAETDIRNILRYIAVNLREVSTAENMYSRFEETILSLRTMPERSALVPDGYLASLGIRMTSVGNYLLFYTVNRSANVVNVLRVLYGRHRQSPLLSPPPPGSVRSPYPAKDQYCFVKNDCGC